MSVSQIHVKMVALASMSLDPINVHAAVDIQEIIAKVINWWNVDNTHIV